MKKRIIYIGFLLFGVLLNSCNDIYDYGDNGTLNYDIIFSDFKSTGYFLNKAYSYMPRYGSNSAGGTFLASFTDEAQDAQAIVNSPSLEYYNGKMSSSVNMLDGTLYSKLYEGIRICNIFLENIDNATNMQVESYRSKWKGEAYILRAFYYLQLIKHFGPVPIIKENLPIDYDFSKISRPTFYENVKAIIDDCELALKEPELPMRVNLDVEKGSMSRSVAYAIMSQAILYAASPLWCDGKNYWNEALTITERAKKELELAGFGLYNPTEPNIPGVYSKYQEYFLMSPEYVENPSNDKETIYAQIGQIDAIWQNYGLPMIPDVNRAGISPSQELVDSYETIDGVNILDLEKPYKDDLHLIPNYNPKALVENGGKYNPENPYENRDPRLHSTIYCNGDFYKLNTSQLPIETFVGGNCGISETNNRYTRTGYYLRKFAHYDSNKLANKDGYYRYFRMAEIYLNFAEASFYANGKPTTEAIEALNKVRRRAGIKELSGNISTKDFELRLRNERRVEFAFEEHRYFDLRRWRIQENFENIVTGMRIMKDDNMFKYNRLVVQERNVTDSKYLMWPIPLDEQNKYKKFGIDYQNPGW